MKRHPSLIIAAAMLLAAVPCLATDPRPIPPDQLQATVKMQMDLLRARLPSNDPLLSGYVDQIETELRARAEAVARGKNYQIEAQYMGEAFGVLILPKTQEALRLMVRKDLGAEKVRERLSLLDNEYERKLEKFNGLFSDKHKDAINAVVQARLEERARQIQLGNMAGGPLSGLGGQEAFAYFRNHSPLITTGQEAVMKVVYPRGPAGPGTTPGPVTTLPAGPVTTLPAGPVATLPAGPVATLPAGPGAALPTGPNGGQDGEQNGGQPTPGRPSWSDILGSITGDAAPQLLSNSAGYALQERRYAEALDLARLALERDPGNKDALAIVHAARGRGDAIDAGAAGMSAAKAATASFAPPGIAGGGAHPSAEISAMAAAGAARVAGEQAGNGARNALKLGDVAGALDILSKALRQDPHNPALLNLRAQTYGRLGRWEEALRDAAAGLALAPGNMALLNTKALSENRTRRYRDALATSEQMIAADPRGAWGYANRAHAHGGLGDKGSMMADINRAAALDPSFQRAAADAATLQLPSDSDVMFLFPGEAGKGGAKEPAASAPGRGRSFTVVVCAGIAGGLLLALGLLSLALAPLKDSVASVFTRSKPAARPAVATAPPASAGGLIRGQYEISRQIGAGGMGMVYEGTDRSLGRRVAIKKMRDELRQNPRDRERFIIEAKTVASLHHPNIVDIYAIAEDGDDVYLVFEYVDGKTVHDMIQSSGRLGAAEALGVTRAMGEALTYAHSRGVIHRDMKPSNVMMTGDGRIKVMDFGIARMAKDALTRYSMTNTVVGTPPYMAPEQEQGVVRKESDVYSLAICSYEMLTGKLPFIGIGAGMLMNKINMSYIPPSRNIAGLPASLDDIFLKAFQADPDQRYRAPQEFASALEGAFGGIRGRA